MRLNFVELGRFGSPAVGGSNYVSLAKAPLSRLEKGAEDPSPCPLPAGERIQAAYGIRHPASTIRMLCRLTSGELDFAFAGIKVYEHQRKRKHDRLKLRELAQWVWYFFFCELKIICFSCWQISY
jgi:hypothetical protein